MSMPRVSSRSSRLRHAFMVALIALAALPGTACVRNVPINTSDPLYGARYFVVEPLNFSNISVGRLPEAVYLARKSEKQQQSWQIDKIETAQHYFAAAAQTAGGWSLQVQPAPPPGPGYFIVRPSVSFVEPGHFSGFVDIPARVNIVLEIFAPDGRRVALEAMSTQVSATTRFGFRSVVDWSKVASGSRMRQAGTQLGYQTAVYLARRVGVRRPNGALVR